MHCTIIFSLLYSDQQDVFKTFRNRSVCILLPHADCGSGNILLPLPGQCTEACRILLPRRASFFFGPFKFLPENHWAKKNRRLNLSDGGAISLEFSFASQCVFAWPAVRHPIRGCSSQQPIRAKPQFPGNHSTSDHLLSIR